jgi:peptidyl-prolyl cis-trans isomerase D
MPLAQVKDKAQTLLTDKLSAEKAKQEGVAKLAKLTSDANVPIEGLSSVILVSRDAMAQQNPKLIEAALRASTAKLPTWIGVDLGAEGYRIVRVNKTQEGAQVLANQNRDQYLQLWSNAEMAGYYEYLKEKLKVKIKAPKADAKNDPKGKAT